MLAREEFFSGDFNLEDELGRGRKPSLDDQALRAAVESKPDASTRTRVFTIAQPQNIRLPLGVMRKVQKWILHDLTYDQRSARYAVCFNLLVRLKSETFLNRV